MNWEMIGHEWAVDLLKEHVLRDQVRHAYLFTGPQGVGRRTLALRLAQVLNCSQSTTPGEACHTCRTCRQIERMQYADLMVIQAEQQGGVLKVDQVRELQRGLSLAPYEGRYRVALLMRFEEANASTMNAMLKTLEEPAPKVILTLTAESSEKLLPTIVSRCEVLRLRPPSIEFVCQGLQTYWGLDAERAQLLAQISGGRPGFAISLHLNPEKLPQRQIWLDEHGRLISASRVERFAFAESVSQPAEKETLRQMLFVWLSLWRDVLLCAAGASVRLANPDRQVQIEEWAAAFGLQTAHSTAAAIERTIDLLEKNVNARLVTEVLLLDLPRL